MDTNNFALRLKRVFKEKTKLDGKPYTQAEVLEGLHGVVTRVYLWKLRNSRASNPSMQVVNGLADFFGVDPGYFFEIDDSQAGSLQNNLAREIGIRAVVLKPEEQQIVLYVIEAIRTAQKKENK
ncbi:MAG: helix-turn-helix domain-containing protein [Anaerolineales bacterium]